MKKLLIAMLTLALMLPFAATSFACEECIPADEATEETPEEDVCVEPRGSMVPMNPSKMRHAFLMSYVNKLTALGGVYTGGNRFDVMKQIFEIEKLA